ncbi:hypothetical protein MTO96_022291 [Rhipicephalus appendiculatus]
MTSSSREQRSVGHRRGCCCRSSALALKVALSRSASPWRRRSSLRSNLPFHHAGLYGLPVEPFQSRAHFLLAFLRRVDFSYSLQFSAQGFPAPPEERPQREIEASGERDIHV